VHVVGQKDIFIEFDMGKTGGQSGPDGLCNLAWALEMDLVIYDSAKGQAMLAGFIWGCA